MSKGRISIVEGDGGGSLRALAAGLREEGYQVDIAADDATALGHAQDHPPDLLLVELPGQSPDGGQDLVQQLRAVDPDLSVVVTVAAGAVPAAVAAMQRGASDYLVRPVHPAKLTLVVARELERRRLRQEAGQLRLRLSERYQFQDIVGNAPVMQDVFKIMAEVAASRASVLITGAPGTGKRLVAAALHRRSPWATHPFVTVPCATLAESALERELFGQERGPGGRYPGRLRQARGGTLFLDGIAQIPPAVQNRLLRALKHRAFEPVGGGDLVTLDVRIIAATDRALAAEVREGRFRDDLFRSLGPVELVLPPLRARFSDLPLLAVQFLRRFASQHGKPQTSFTDEALALLAGYHWPGNVGELETVIERAVVLCQRDQITPADLPATMRRPWQAPALAVPGASLAELEQYAILRTVAAVGGSTSRAARVLGVSVRKVQYRLSGYLRAGATGGQTTPEALAHPPQS